MDARTEAYCGGVVQKRLVSGRCTPVRELGDTFLPNSSDLLAVAGPAFHHKGCGVGQAQLAGRGEHLDVCQVDGEDAVGRRRLETPKQMQI